MEEHEPFETEPNGDADRGRDGRFLPNNRAARGNPGARKVAALRSALLEAVTEQDLAEVMGKLKSMALAGDLDCIRELLDRCLGRSRQHVEVDVDLASRPLVDLSDDELLLIASGGAGE